MSRLVLKLGVSCDPGTVSMTQQRAIEAARDLSDNTLELFEDCDVIEAKLQEYLQIELGQSNKDIILIYLIF